MGKGGRPAAGGGRWIEVAPIRFERWCAGFAERHGPYQSRPEAYGIARRPECPGRFRPMDTRHMLGDARGLGALGWMPRVDVREGLRRYVAWIQTRGDVREQFTRAEERLRALGIVRETRS